jgi:Phage integrase family
MASIQKRVRNGKTTYSVNYRDPALLDNQVLPAFAAARLVDIDALAVREWLAGPVGGGLSAKRARKAHQVLAQVLDAAVDGGRLARNVAAGVKLPRRSGARWASWTPSRSRPSPTPSTRGTRRSCGSPPTPGSGRASWSPSGSAGSTCSAAPSGLPRRRRRSPAGWSGGGVKTHEARTVRLPRSLAAEVGAYLVDRPCGPEDLVFTAPLGGPLRQSKFVPGYFKPAVRAAGLPATLRFYDLRHTAAFLLIREGASVKAVQKQLGHATASITLDTYGHLFPTNWTSSPSGWRTCAPGRLRRGGQPKCRPASPRSRLAAQRCRQMTSTVGAGGGARTLMPVGPNAFKAWLSADSSTPALTCQATVRGPLARGGTSGSVGACIRC